MALGQTQQQYYFLKGSTEIQCISSLYTLHQGIHIYEVFHEKCKEEVYPTFQQVYLNV